MRIFFIFSFFQFFNSSFFIIFALETTKKWFTIKLIQINNYIKKQIWHQQQKLAV